MKEKKINFFFILILILLIQSTDISGQFLKDNRFNISADYYRGYFSDKQKRNFQVINQYINGFSLSFSKLPDGSKSWHSIYNYPETGFTFTYLVTGNYEVLGHIVAVSKYIDFHLFSKNDFNIDGRTALGTAFTSKMFHPVDLMR